ncbi:FIP1[V]-like protein [Magnolia sinica]|uniref:FIP1[V]-like protein n=1 Tax=Magnolia sinica TaxID=86752 RepID=UPI0026594757|nr:FIP1[V]-like protein [Magnolia sinica]
MVEMDDFGDLYTDVEVQMNGGIGSFHHLYIEEGEKNDSKPVDSHKKGIKVDSVGGDNKVSEYEEGLVGSDSEMPVLEADDGNQIVENGSDSEDDLHIVLNEEDCRVFPTSRGTSMVNKGRVEGSDDEDEDGDLVIVTEADSLSKDRKWVDPLQLPIDGLDQCTGGPGAERGNVLKGGYLSQHSQFKYVRPHAAAFPGSMRTGESGGVASFSSPLSSRGDWDVNGGSQQKMSCSGLITSSCNFGIPAVTQNAFGFSLPRNRTILDVGIETFERKPWRHPGVDITDFFNFGLDEESWKNYCKSMENFRQQTTMQTKIPVYESLRPFQVYEPGFLHRTVASEITLGEFAHPGLEERISSFAENVDGGVRSSEMPKGRAILVEGSIGERRPSMDVRRPRHRDLDVVIQITVQDSTEDASVSGNEEPKHIDGALLNLTENGGSEDSQNMQRFGNARARGDVQPADSVDESTGRYSQPKAKCDSSNLDSDYHRDEMTDLDRPLSWKVKEPLSEENIEALETAHGSKVGDEGYPCKADKEAESAFDSQIQHSTSPPYLGGHSKASKAGVPTGMEKSYHHTQKPTSSSVSGPQEPIMSEHHHSNDLKSDNSKTDEDIKDTSQNQRAIQDEQNHHSRARLRSVAELKIPMDDDGGSPWANRKDWYRGARVNCGVRKEKRRHHDFDEEEDLSYYGETEISIGYRGRGFAEKQTMRNAYTKQFHRKDDLQFREETKPFLRRSRNEREYFHERRDNEITERECYYQAKGVGVIAHKESKLLISGNSFYPEKEGYPCHRRKSENSHRLVKGPADDDFAPERRHREDFFEEKYGRHAPYCGREEEPIQEKYRRPVPYYSREEESIYEKYRRHAPRIGGEIELLERRERDDRSLHFDMDGSPRSVGNDGRYWRHPDRRLWSPQTCREFHIADGRQWRNVSPPRNHAYSPLRSDGRYGDHWGPSNFRELYSRRNRDGGGFISSHDKGFDFDRDDHDAEGRPIYTNDIVYNEKRRYSWQAKVADWSDDEASFGHQERVSLYDSDTCFQYERSSRHGHDSVNHDSAHGGKLLDDHHLHRGRKSKMVERSTDSEVRKHISSVSDTVDGSEVAVLKRRDSVNLHLNGWKGKHPQRSSKTGDTRCDRHDPTNHVADKESAAFRHSDEVHTVKEVPPRSPKVASGRPCSISSKIERFGPCNPEHSTDHNNEKWLDKYPVVQHQEASMLEEGQLPSEEPENKEARAGARKRAFEKTAPTSAVEVRRSDNVEEKKPRKETVAEDNKAVGGYDNHRILETLAKMEKRRERFKEPIAPKKEPDKSTKPQPEPVVEIAEVQPQRPARKRRWGGC